MDLPHIHSCLQLSSENENLRKKVHRLKREKQTTERKLQEFEEKSRVEILLRDYVTTRDVYVQTEPPKAWLTSGYGITKRKEEKSSASSELEKTNKLLSMHSQLMKRYEKEVKTNLNHVETISSLNEEKVKQLQLEKVTLQNEVTKRSRSSSKGKSQEKSGISEKSYEEVLKKLRMKCEKYAEQNKKLKAELKGLDPGFFEEIEDTKFALRQSAKLNKEYERTLRKICQQYAVPYPNPERVLQEK